MAVRNRLKKLYCRHRIAKLLYGVLDSPMTLVIAQTGYGKTSSLTSFLSRRKDIGVIGLTLTDALQEDAPLWEAFCQAVSERAPELGEALQREGFPRTELERRRAVAGFHSGLDGLNILLLDDFTLNASEAFLGFLTSLAESRPEHLCIVLLCRRYPAFLTPSFFHSDCCGVIDQEDLDFTREEIVEYFAANDCTLSENEVTKAETLAVGWPLAVVLLCEEYRRTGFLRQTAEQVRLIEETVFSKLPPEDQLLFARLSLLDSFTVEQADYITQDRKTGYQLTRFFQENCFLRLDPASGFYTIHPLIRAAAREKLPLLENDLSQLYYRCASWYDIHEERLKALRFYCLTQNDARIFELLGEPYATELVDQDPVAVHEAFPELAARSRRKYAMAVLADIYAQLVYLNRAEGLRQLFELRASFEETNKKNNLQNQVLGELALLESLSQIDDLSLFSRCSQKAASYFGEGRSVLFPRTTGCLFGSPSILWRYYKGPGTLNETVQRISDVFRDMSMLSKGALSAAEWLARAEYAYYTGSFEEAPPLAYRAIYEARPRGQFDIVGAALFFLALLSIMQGQFENAYVYQGELRRIAQRSSVPPGSTAAISYISSCMGRMEPVSMELLIPSFNGFLMKIVEGRWLLHQCYDIQLEMFAENMIVEQGACVFEQLYGYLYLAAAKERLGESTDADKALKRAVRLAEPDGLRLPFVENAPFLYEVLARSDSPFIVGLRDMAKTYRENVRSYGRSAVSYSLSATEMQIIRWYAGGCKQGEVARNLNLSVTEVRRTINDIYRKIGVADINEIAALVLR